MSDTAAPTSLAPQGPSGAIAAPAALADTDALTRYRPNAQDLALAGALFTSGATTLQDLAAAAGLSDSTLARIREDPTRCAWILKRAVDATRSRALAVYAHIAHQASTSNNPLWARLFLDRFDEDFRKQAAAAAPINHTQFNFLGSMPDSELRAFIDQTARRVLGGPQESK